MNFAEWFCLSDAERKSVQQGWLVLEPGYWHTIAVQAAARFAAEFGANEGVTHVFKSLYQARELIIAVQTDPRASRKLDLPKSYLGFRVAQFAGTIPDGVLVEPASASSLPITKPSVVKPQSATPPRRRVKAKGGHRILALKGEIDFHRVWKITAQLSDAIKERPEKLVLDLANLSYIDSSGLAALIEALRKVRAYGGMLYLVGMRDDVRTIFEISRLDQVFPIFQDAAEAIASV
jgi:anti-sigma B factor antagonist